jgi:hypothetical protein
VSVIPVHPVQRCNRPQYEQAYAPQAVTLKAYEVYCHIYRPQEALITGGCRGGFATSELIAFLYASSFPKAEWSMRFEEACRGAVNL